MVAGSAGMGKGYVGSGRRVPQTGSTVGMRAIVAIREVWFCERSRIKRGGCVNPAVRCTSRQVRRGEFLQSGVFDYCNYV